MLDEQASTYSIMQIRTLKLLANVNTVNENDDSNRVIVVINSGITLTWRSPEVEEVISQ